MKVAALLAAALLSLMQPTWTPPLRVIDKGAESALDETMQVTARDQAQWTAAWHRHAPGRALPAIQWSKEMVVGVFAGSRPTAGYSVEIVGFREEGDRMIIGYRETVPGRGIATAQIITSPYALAVVPQHAGEVTFEKIR